MKLADDEKNSDDEYDNIDANESYSSSNFLNMTNVSDSVAAAAADYTINDESVSIKKFKSNY